jgi:hypothetical protein
MVYLLPKHSLGYYLRQQHLYTHIQITIYMAQSPCFLSPLADSLLLPFLIPFTYLETLLAVTGSVHLGLRLLVNWPPLSQPFPNPSPFQIPSTQVTKRLTVTTSRIRLLLSGTIHTYIFLKHNLHFLIHVTYF